MRSFTYALFSLLVLAVTNSSAAGSPYLITADSVYRHISVLADDSLEGREVGEIGEWKAGQYIQNVFVGAGLAPTGDDDDYLQAYDFIKRIDLGPGNKLSINGTPLVLFDDYQPLLQSDTAAALDFESVVDAGYGITVAENEGDYDDYEGIDVAGKAVLVRRFSPPKDQHEGIDFDKYSAITDKINNAVEHEASAIIFITPSDKDDAIKDEPAAFVHAKDIPVLWLKRAGLEKLGLSIDEPLISSVTGATELIRVRDTSYNVIGFIPGRSDTTVIIGAHYDHLGWGGPSSMYKGEEKMIHNGADDNASGVAVMLELARHYSSERDRLHYSLLFIAFSGEEAGVLGSTHFAKNMTIDSSKVRMMLNLDMIGRLADQDGLAIMGTGTCEEFKTFFDSVSYDHLKLSLKESGVGPSDHTPFYNRGIPSMTFFTGPHSDYHKPTDDIERIDTHGIVRVTQLARDIIDHFDAIDSPLTFQKTKDSGMGKRRSQFSVSLGVMPDHVAEVKGVRVDGVIPDRPGAKAGVIEGDVIIRIGDNAIGDIYDYMSALGKFSPGDSTVVVVERGVDTLSLDLVF
ncbi:MAG: M20/M25/M40 family metallo-hydrolase [Candidatus Zixiibacteriota bacterium]